MLLLDAYKNWGKYKNYVHPKFMMKDASVGGMRLLPAQFLIDEEGIIVDLFRANKMGETMPFERIEAFIPREKMCRCNESTCVSTQCRGAAKWLNNLSSSKRERLGRYRTSSVYTNENSCAILRAC